MIFRVAKLGYKKGKLIYILGRTQQITVQITDIIFRDPN